MPGTPPHEPTQDCPLCSRLVAFREENRQAWPDWFNAPVPTFGALDASLLIVGLAPGLRGANRTGRPFTGDFAGDLLYPSLLTLGMARGTYEARSDDGLELLDCAITNAVRCVPPKNKPLPAEAANCRVFLTDLVAAMPRVRAILALGRVAHESVLRSFGARLAAYPFAHGGRHDVDDVGRTPPRSLTLFDSYHCSRYNTSTRVLTPEMFLEVMRAARDRCRDAEVGQPQVSGL